MKMNYDFEGLYPNAMKVFDKEYFKRIEKQQLIKLRKKKLEKLYGNNIR